MNTAAISGTRGDHRGITRSVGGVVGFVRCTVLVLLMALTTALTGYEIQYQAGQPVGQERGLAPATFNLIRNNSGGVLDVQVEVIGASQALPADYVWQWLSPTGWVEVGSPTPGAVPVPDAVIGWVSFQDTQASISMRIVPVDDALVEGREELSLGIVLPAGDPAPYSRGAKGTVTVIIADDDHKARISVIRATADEDISLRGNDPDDVMSLRRGIVRVVFDDFINNGTPSAYFDRVDFPRNLSVEIANAATIDNLVNATKPADYVIKYKISGHNNPSTATDLHSQVGLATNASGWNFTTGLNFRLMAALAGESTVPLKEQDSDDLTPNSIPGNTTFYFESDPAETVHTSVGTAISAINFTPALTRPVPSGTKVKIIALGSGTEAPDDVVVERTYGTGAKVLRLGGGSGGLYEGDVISIDGDEKPYVIVSDPVLAPEPGGRTSARVTIFAYEGGVDGGLAKAQTTAATVTTMLTPKFFGENQEYMQIGVPNISTRVEFSIEPVADNQVELAESVLLSMTADNDYIIQGASQALVTIADRDLVAGVRMKSSAGLPGIPGAFEFTLSRTYTEPVTVEFDLYAKTLNALGQPTLIDAEGVTFLPIARSVTFGRNTLTAAVSITPIAGAIDPATLTVSLRGSDNYKTGGGTSGFNPSATMIINNVIGTVTINAVDGIALEGGVNNGLFRVSLASSMTRTSDLPIKLAVGGTAVAGRYEFFNPAQPSTTYAVTSGFVQGVSIPITASSVDIGVRALENIDADPDSQVQLTVNNTGTNYVNGSPFSATVSILDNEPALRVVAVDDAVLPSTSGRFRFTYPGVAVDQLVTVRYTFSGAVRGTDFDAETTVNLTGGTNLADLLITPRAGSTATSVTVTLTSNSAYHIDPTASTATIQFIPEDEYDPSDDKPTPGTVGASSNSSGGCGLGSGMAAFLSLLLLTWIGLRRREI